MKHDPRLRNREENPPFHLTTVGFEFLCKAFSLLFHFAVEEDGDAYTRSDFLM